MPSEEMSNADIIVENEKPRYNADSRERVCEYRVGKEGIRVWGNLC